MFFSSIDASSDKNGYKSKNISKYSKNLKYYIVCKNFRKKLYKI